MLLELRGAQRILRHRRLHKEKAAGSDFRQSASDEHDHEGRVITLEYEDFYFVTVYTPNSQSELARLFLPDAVGGRIPGLSEGTGRSQTGDRDGRYERCP